MKQILHIFLKDARRFWPEILISVAITAAFVGMGEYQWMDFADVRSQTLGVMGGFLEFLLLVSWWILIARSVQAERLVGDTQFWITRPYRWNRLLAAKLLFVAVFLYVPYFIAQCLLLVQAGFHPQHTIAGLMYSAMLLTGVLILPLAAIAAVTSNFVRMTLTLLGIFLCFIAMTVGDSIAGSSGATSYSVGFFVNRGDAIGFGIAVVFFAAAIVLQYSSRRVWMARGILLALPVLLTAMSFFASRYEQEQMSRIYPAAPGAAPIQLAYSPNSDAPQTFSIPASSNAAIPINLRFAESGVAEGFAVMPDAVRLEIKGPDGSRWNTQWMHSEQYKFLPGESQFTEGIGIPLEIYNKFKSMPLSVHLDFAVTQARAGKVVAIPMPLERATVADFAMCAPISWTHVLGQAIGIHCVSAVHEPQLTYISTRWSDGPCSGSPTAPDTGVLGTGWAGTLDPSTGELNIHPTVDLHVNLANSVIPNTPGGRPRYLCTGTPITFTQFNRVARMQTSVDITGFHLPTIAVAGNMITITQ